MLLVPRQIAARRPPDRVPRPTRWAALFAMLATLASLASAAGARADFAAGVWSAAGSLTKANRPSLALDARGDAFIAYPLTEVGEINSQVHVVEHAAGSGEQLLDLGTVSDPALNSLEPRIAGDAAGDLLVAWYASGDVWAATRPVGGAFTAPVDVSRSGKVDPISTIGSTVVLAMDAAGNAVLAWPQWTDDAEEHVGPAAALRPAGGAFGTPRTLAYPGAGSADATGLTAGIGGGRAVFGYASQNRAFANIWPLGGDPGDPQMVSALGDVVCASGAESETQCSPALVAVGEDGGAIAAWTAGRRDGSAGLLDVTAAAPGGSFAGAQTLASGDSSHHVGIEPTLATGSAGAAIVAWTETTFGAGVHTAVEVARRPAGSDDFGGAIDTGAADGSLAPRVALDAAGDAVAIWKSPAGPATYDVHGALLAAGASAFGTTAAVGTAGVQEPAARLAVTPGGDAAVAFVWPITNGVGGAGLRLAGFDGAGPQISGLAPAEAPAGVDTAFHADVSDAWSTVTAVHWDFGDGAGATGTDPHHSFAEPGEHTVTITAEDAAGQSSSADLVVTVRAPGGGGGSGGDGGSGGAGGSGGGEPHPGGGETGAGDSPGGAASGGAQPGPPGPGGTGGGESHQPGVAKKKPRKCGKGRKLKHGKCVKRHRHAKERHKAGR